MKTLSFRVSGLSPMLMHNSRKFLNPLHPENKAFKQISGKRKKTEDDHIKLSDMEFQMSLYINEDGRVFLPSENIEAMLANAAKRSKQGKDAIIAISAEDAILEYKGPKDVAGLLADINFRDIRPVAVQKARIARTRPIFKDWSATLKIHFDESVVNTSDIEKFMKDAGAYIGFGDFRPKFGRFQVESVEVA